MAIDESTEQTRAGIRFKRADERGLSPCPRSSLMELRKHRVRQAEELLRLAVRHSDDVFVVAQEDGNPLQPNSLTHEFVRLLARRLACPASDFTICGTRMQLTCWRAAFIPKIAHKSALDTLTSASRSIFTVMCSPECRRMQPRRLTPRSGRP